MVVGVGQVAGNLTGWAVNSDTRWEDTKALTGKVLHGVGEFIKNPMPVLNAAWDKCTGSVRGGTQCASELLGGGALAITRKLAKAGPLSAFSSISTQLVRPDLAPAVEDMFSAGPGRWVDLPTNPTGDIVYTRGLGGNYARGGDGIEEAKRMLRGEADPESRYISVTADGANPLDNVRETNSVYANPMTIRGRLDELGDDIQITRAEGATVDSSVDGIGMFPVQNPSRDTAFSWSKSYLRMHDEFVEGGMRVAPDSRGGRFTQELREAYDGTAQFTRGEYGDYISNTGEVGSAVAAVINKYPY